MERHRPEIFTDGGPWADHDMPCAVCHVNSAVLNLNDASFHPCWSCIAEGWVLRRPRKWLNKWTKKHYPW